MDSIVGKIYSVSCESFVTYDQITIYPGKYLNLILGPNGTGKSSLVAAIILGMGGNPKLLSRSSDLRDYVKNGKGNAWIEVKIYIDDKERTSTFRRSFDLSGKSVFKVNGATMTQKQYVTTIAQYNIQIDNPCQFLPQDKVQDFAKMNPQELLNSTQHAVCTEEMIKNFAKLKEYRNDQSSADKDLTDKRKRLKELEERNAQIENIIEKMSMRQKFLDDIKISEKKKAWLQYDELKRDFDEIQKIIKKAKYDLVRDEKIFNDCKKQSQAVMNLRDNLSSSVTQETKKILDYSSQLEKLEENISELENKIKRAEQNLKSKKADMKERDSEITNASRLLEAFLQDLTVAINACGPDFKEQLSNFTRQSEAIKKDILSLTEKRSDLNYEIDRYQPELNSIRSRITKMQNEGERRLNNLRNSNSDVYNAVTWLRSNRNLFEGYIYEPMLLELRVKEAKNATYVENTISNRDLLAFTCVNKSDVSLLIRKLCTEKRLKINVLHSDEAESCRFTPEIPISHLKKYGFHSYLLDLIDGPAPLLNYLCQANGIHNVAVGTDEIEKHIENLPRHLRLFYSSQNRFQITVSRYTGETSSLCSRISEKNLLCSSIDAVQLIELESRQREITYRSDGLKNQRNAIESEIGQLNEKVNDIVKAKAQLDGKLIRIQEKKRKLKYQEQKIVELKNTKIDIPSEEAKFQRFANTSIQKMIELHKGKISCLENYEKAKQQKEFASTKLYVYKKETIDIENQLRSAEEDYSNSKKRFDAMQTTQQQCKVKCNQKESEAKELCDGRDRNHRSFPYREKFAALPDSLDELEGHLTEVRTRAECMSENQADVVEYENRKIEIDQLKTVLNSVQKDHENLQSQILRIHNIWLPYFQEKIKIINENFSKFMAIMEYAGEVNLTCNDVHDYDSYGIQILVQYRNGAKLQALDRFVQSGGERAVAIAIYSMSLQNITQVPFRCVDEINQGMDPKNERKVFNLIVDETCKVGSSQYFFITPKLLPDLHYNDLLTAIVVFNGCISTSDIFDNTNK